MRKLFRSSPLTRAQRQQRRVALAIAIPVVLIALIVTRRVAGRRAPAKPVVIASPATILVSAAPRPSTVIPFSQGCRTSECHANMTSAPTVHAPVAQDSCASCHAPDSGGHIYPVAKIGASSCRTCHTISDGFPLRHMTLSEDGCTSCHDPHTSTGPGLLRAASVDKTCAQCHPSPQGANRHQPHAAGQCVLCHEPHGSPAAAANVDAICGACHPATARSVARSAHTGKSFESSCLACHSAHASDRKSLLKNEPRELCVTCHEQVRDSVAGVVSHDAVLTGRQCISCHDPHASAHPSMLIADQATVCTTCHDRVVTAADGRNIPGMPTGRESEPFVHGPVAAGNCAACHTVHGGNQERLLKRINPAVLAGGYDTRNYALCFSCHSSELLLAESAAATGFRNGEANLHRVHLEASRDRSRSCSTCHVAHAGQRPRLIAETVSYEGSAWKMPMGFVLTAAGGRCAPGCHEPLEYRRDAGAPVPSPQPRGVP